MSDYYEGNEIAALNNLGVEIGEGDGYSYHRRRHSVRRTTRNSQGQSSSYQCEEQAAVLTTRGKSSTSQVILLERRIEINHHESRPPKNEINHFSHRHALHRYKFLEEDEIVCDICETDILGKAWGCDDCEFFIHKSCSDIPREINHKSHRRDTLTLRSSSNNKFGKFICQACGEPGDGFHYHCSPCKFDLHVACAGSPYTVYYEKHKYPLTLYYDFPINTSKTVSCKICHSTIDKDGWTYYNRDSHFIAHIDCAFDEEEDDNILAIQDRLQTLQIK